MQQDGQKSWATTQIKEGKDEREAMRMAIEELSEQLAALMRLDQGEAHVRTIERVCTYRVTVN